MLLNDILDNIELYIGYLVIGLSYFYCTIYLFCKLQSIILKKVKYIQVLIFGLLLSVFFMVLRMISAQLAHFSLFIIIPSIVCLIFRKEGKPLRTVYISYISFCIVVIIEFVATIMQTTILWGLGIVPHDLVAYMLIVVLTYVLCVLIMRIKRVRKGIQFLQDEKNLGIGLLLSSVIMVLRSINLRDNRDADYLYFYLLFGALIAGFGLYLWIRRSITAHYRERLRLRSEEHYKEMLADRDKEIEKLNQSNAYLAKVVHRDNHLMNAVNSSVNAYFESDDTAYRKHLLSELQTLVRERAELINQEQLKSKLLPSTGNLLIDSAVNSMYIKAAAHGIDFHLTVSATVDEVIGKYISQTDLQTLLSDHIKDAIIAIGNRPEAGGKILVNLSMHNEDYEIAVYDNGVEFDIDTLSKLGLARVTTHADTGGSGIGFMTTFETLQKAYASLIITEFETKTPISKAVSFRFDGKRAFIIHSYRSEELRKRIQRADLTIE